MCNSCRSNEAIGRVAVHRRKFRREDRNLACKGDLGYADTQHDMTGFHC
jgi:hypothetical protein